MKNLFIYALLALMIQSCLTSTDSELISNENETIVRTGLKQIEDFYYLGDIHNEYMLNLAQNFDENQNLNEITGLNYIKNFHKDFVAGDTTLESGLNLFFASDNFGWNYLDHNELKNILESTAFMDEINLGQTLGLLDTWEVSLFQDIVNLSNQDLSFQELDVFITNKISEWKNQGYLVGSDSGNLSAMVLAIGKKSTDWWRANSIHQGKDAKRWAWLVGDLVGAAVGTASAVGAHYANGGSTPEGNGWAVVGGAVGGSTGIVGRAATAIKNWLP